MTILKATPSDYPKLIEIWESSVRATHDFLPEGNICELKPLILNYYFDAVVIFCVKKEGVLTSFIGVADGNIEMLFVDPVAFGQGVGKQLISHAIDQLGANKVDVNEQNPNAIGFYKKMGFVPVGRSETDGQGNPFPLIHMQYDKR